MALGLSPGRSRRRVGDGEQPRGSPRGARGRLRQDHPDASAEIFPLVRSLLGQREGHGHGTPACGVRGCSCSHRHGKTPKLGWGWAAGSRDKGDARPRQPHGGAVISAQPVIKAGALPGGKAGEEAVHVGGTGGCWPYSLPPQFAPPPLSQQPPWHSVPIPIGLGRGQGRTFHPRRHLQAGCGGSPQNPTNPTIRVKTTNLKEQKKQTHP